MQNDDRDASAITRLLDDLNNPPYSVDASLIYAAQMEWNVWQAARAAPDIEINAMKAKAYDLDMQGIAEQIPLDSLRQPQDAGLARADIAEAREFFRDCEGINGDGIGWFNSDQFAAGVAILDRLLSTAPADAIKAAYKEGWNNREDDLITRTSAIYGTAPTDADKRAGETLDTALAAMPEAYDLMFGRAAKDGFYCDLLRDSDHWMSVADTPSAAILQALAKMEKE